MPWFCFIPQNPAYSSGRYELAEKWCSTGMTFLKHLSQSMRSNYNERVKQALLIRPLALVIYFLYNFSLYIIYFQMTNTYADILDQMDKSKTKKLKKGLEEWHE